MIIMLLILASKPQKEIIIQIDLFHVKFMQFNNKLN